MKNIFVFIWIIFYAMSSFGTTVYMHQCSGATIFSVLEKSNHDSCPICAMHHSCDHHEHKNGGCCDDSCNDIEVKFEQIKEQLSGSYNVSVAHFSPAIFVRFWVNLSPPTFEINASSPREIIAQSFSDSSPPPYLINCIFRI